jgi:hypothetical protein
MLGFGKQSMLLVSSNNDDDVQEALPSVWRRGEWVFSIWTVAKRSESRFRSDISQVKNDRSLKKEKISWARNDCKDCIQDDLGEGRRERERERERERGEERR